MKISILYEDADLLVIDKPAGLVVHADGKTNEPSVVDWILARHPDMREVGEPLTLSTGEVIFRPGIVHRLDRDTSGALLIAKNQAAYEFAKKQFQDREVRKTYNAFVYGGIRVKIGAMQRIDRPIARSKNDFRKWTAMRGSRGEEREAVTEYVLVKKGAVDGQEYSYVEVHPLTGRTHQIRVHFKAINHPVVCDSLYAPNRECLPSIGRLALHASALEFKNMSSQTVRAEAPLPAEFSATLAKFA